MPPLTLNPVVAGRARKAWEALSPEQQASIGPLLQEGNDQAVLAAKSQYASIDTNVPRALVLGNTALNKDASGILGSFSPELILHVANDGTLVGTGKYQTLDPGWIEAFAVWLENIPQTKGPFSTTPQVIPIPDRVTFAMAGDWGTGDWRGETNPAPATKVARQIANLHPDFTIHLGDVYYSGTASEEQHLLLDMWPVGASGAFALNSNHEMYSGAKPYFNLALAGRHFGLQQHCSFFALENKNWVIVGLDSAYHSDEMALYMHGSLGNDGVQQNFLRQQAAKGKPVIVLTHHNGLVQNGSAPEKAAHGADPLYKQVMEAFAAPAAPAYWYWAHVHSAIAYSTQAGKTLCRCCGHGALPQGPPDSLKRLATVEWYESSSANDAAIPQRVRNGFVFLSLDGPVIKESFYDENGTVRWQR